MYKGIKKLAIGVPIFTLLMGTAVFAENPLNEIKFTIGQPQYTVGDTTNTMDTSPYIKDGRTMLPVKYVAQVVGVKTEDILWDEETKTVTILKGSSIIQMTIGSNILAVDGQKITMDTKAEIKDERTMLPVSFIGKALGIEMKWNGTTKTVTIPAKISMEKEVIEQKNEYDYTYEDLLNKAIANSKDLEKAKTDLEKTDILRDDLADNIDYIPIGNGNGAIEAKATGALQKLKALEVQQEMDKKTIGMTEDKLKYNLKSAYYDVIQSERKKMVAELSRDVARETMEQTNLKYEHGLASELEKNQAKRSYEETVRNVKILDKTVNINYENLNQLLGFENDVQYVLADELTFEKYDGDSLDSHILDVLNKSPELWALEKKTYLAELGVSLYTYNAELDPYDVKKIDVKAAKITYADAKDQYEQSIRDINSKMEILEDQYDNLLLKLEKAQDDLKIAIINMEVGNGIALDVEKAKLQLENTKKDMKETIIQYDQLKMVYEKPWVASNYNQNETGDSEAGTDS